MLGYGSLILFTMNLNLLLKGFDVLNVTHKLCHSILCIRFAPRWSWGDSVWPCEFYAPNLLLGYRGPDPFHMGLVQNLDILMPFVLVIFNFVTYHVLICPRNCFGGICIVHFGSIPQTHFGV